MSNSVPTDSSPPSLLGDYFTFLKQPTYDRSLDSPKAILSKIWRLYTGHVLVIILVALGIQFLSQWLISIEDNKLGDLLESTPAYQFLLLAVVFAPLIEEIMFRLPLCFSRQNLLIPITLILLPMSGYLLQTVEGSREWGLLLLWTLMGSLLYFFWVLLGRISRRTGEQWFARHLLKLVYGSSIVFGLLHIMNYPKQAWIAAPLLVLPQIILGLLLAYVRVKFGFWWSVFTHGLHNGLASSPILFLSLGSPQLRQTLFDKAADVELRPFDYVMQGVFLIWILGISYLVITTAARLVQEWRQAKLLEQAS